MCGVCVLHDANGGSCGWRLWDGACSGEPLHILLLVRSTLRVEVCSDVKDARYVKRSYQIAPLKNAGSRLTRPNDQTTPRARLKKKSTPSTNALVRGVGGLPLLPFFAAAGVVVVVPEQEKSKHGVAVPSSRCSWVHKERTGALAGWGESSPQRSRGGIA